MSDIKMRVKNVPENAFEFDIWVVRIVDADMWFYGCYKTIERAEEVAKEIGNGLVLG